MEYHYLKTKDYVLTVLFWQYKQKVKELYERKTTNSEIEFFKSISSAINKASETDLEKNLNNALVIKEKMGYLFPNEEEAQKILNNFQKNKENKEELYTLSYKTAQAYCKQTEVLSKDIRERTIYCLAVYLGYQFTDLENLYQQIHDQAIANFQSMQVATQATPIEEKYAIQNKNLQTKQKWLMANLVSPILLVSYLAWCTISHSPQNTTLPAKLLEESNLIQIDSMQIGKIVDSTIFKGNPDSETAEDLSLITTQILNSNYLYDEQNEWATDLHVNTKEGEDNAGALGTISEGDYKKSKTKWNNGKRNGAVNIPCTFVNLRLALTNKSIKPYQIKNLKLQYLYKTQLTATAICEGYYADRGNAYVIPAPTSKEVEIPAKGFAKLQDPSVVYSINAIPMKSKEVVNFYVKIELLNKYKGHTVKFKVAVEVWENNEYPKATWINSDREYLLGL